jgi:glycosyltransferase involved in cell wall biosynthesis
MDNIMATDGVSKRGRVLMVAFHFTPAGGSGTQRSLKFARYLPEFRWDVEVLTARTTVHELLDPTLMAEVPSCVAVHSTPCFIPGVQFGIRGWYPDFVGFPDRFANWFPFAVRKGRRLLRERHFDVVYATHPARTALLIGWALACSSGLPLVCDLRDPWLDGESREYFSSLWGSRLYFWLFRRLERGIMRRAARIIVNSKQVQNDLAARFPEIQEKVMLLPNGYDETDFGGVVAAKSDDRCVTFVHAGEIYPMLRDPRPLLEAFEDLIREGTIGTDDVKVRFVGGGDRFASEEFRSWLQGKAVSETVAIEPPVSHRAAIAQMLGADVLLLLQISALSNSQIPAKVFEYLRTGRPILTLAPSGSATGQMAAMARNSWTLDGEDSAGLRSALREIVALHREGKLRDSFPVGGQFERREMTKQLSSILSSCLPVALAGAISENESCELSRS